MQGAAFRHMFSRGGRRGAWAGVTLLALVAFAPDVAAQADPETVKAAFLHRFGSFVRWPNAGGSGALCVLGPQAVFNAVRGVAQGSAQARRLTDPGDVSACSVAYLAGGEEEVRAAVRAAATNAVLTVTDSNFTPDVRGVIHFVIVDDRVRFHIDDAQAATNGLQIDSRLLNLAVSVRRRTVG